MRIKLSSIFVDDQQKALEFYTEKLGFIIKQDEKIGDVSWLTVVSPEEPEGTELVLEPDNNPTVPTRAFKKAIKDNGIPFTAFEVDDLQKEYKRMKKLGVKFTQEPIDMGPITGAMLDDTCGNLIQLFQIK